MQLTITLTLTLTAFRLEKGSSTHENKKKTTPPLDGTSLEVVSVRENREKKIAF